MSQPESEPMRVGAPRVDLLSPPDKTDVHGASPFEQLQAALSKTARKELLLLKVPLRPGVGLVFDPNIEDPDRKSWQRRATKKKRGSDDEVDEMLFAQLVIANTCVAVTINGVEAHDSEDTPLTFRHAQLWAMVDADNPQDCIKDLFGADPHVRLASGEVLLASGLDDDLTEDPTVAGA